MVTGSIRRHSGPNKNAVNAQPAGEVVTGM
jgi:hypothetical protein